VWQSLFISSSDMKRFVLHCSLFFGALLSVLVASCFFIPDKAAGKTMLGALPKKFQVLDSLPGSRIVFVGGSGLAMGMVTAKIQERLGVPCYNLGLHAGLGLVYQLKSAQTALRKGDVVVVVPEYANFSGDFAYGQTELVACLVDVLPAHLRLIDLRQWFYLTPNLLEHGAGKLRRVCVRASAADHSDDYDAFGDALYGDEPDDVHFNFGPAKQMDKNDFSNVVMPYLLEFKHTCRKIGVEVIVLPPAFNRSSYNNQISYVREIANQLKRIGMGFSAEPDRYAMDDRYFRETAYHLNMLGRKERTRLMADDLWSIIRCEKYGEVAHRIGSRVGARSAAADGGELKSEGVEELRVRE